MTSKSNNSKLVIRFASFVVRTLLNILFYLAIVIAIVNVSQKVYNFGYQIFGNVAVSEAPGTNVDIVIKSGESTMNVANKLKLNRLIVSEYSFYAKAKLTNQTIMPGLYELNTSMTYDDIFAIITVPSDDEDVTATNKK